MTSALLPVTVAVVFLAYANGANDNFKPVATLVGSGTATYRRALLWATVTTLAGSLLAMMLAAGLLKTFSGKGLVPDSIAADPAFLTAVGLAAAATVLIATVTGLPISTTHALTGALVGVGLIATAGQIAWGRLGGAFVIPLLASPLIATLLAVGAYPPLRWLRRRFNVTSDTCVCLESGQYMPVAVAGDGSLIARSTGSPTLVVADNAQCVARYSGRVLGVSAAAVCDRLHYLSAGAVGLARGMNDTPKILALLAATHMVAPQLGFVLVGVAIAVGGLLSARRVARTMSERITDMNVGQALAANLVTALLVLVASRFSVPVSTTHVSCGSLFGIGSVTGQARGRTIATILAAWVTTLPLAALFGAACYLALS